MFNILKSKLLSSLVICMSVYAGSASASFCVPDNSNAQDGVTVLEYGIGTITYAGNGAGFDDDNPNGIYVRIKSPKGTIRSYPVHIGVNLNDAPGNAMVSTIKTALLTGAKVKLSSNSDNCRTIDSIALMIP